MRSAAALTLLLVALPCVAISRDASTTAVDGSATGLGPERSVVAGEHYRAGGFHRFLLGADYRRLWTAPIPVPVLDMRVFAGGLQPVMRVGGQETLGLALKGGDGRDYTFRGLDKDPSDILPPEFRGTFADELLQDQIASSLPGGALSVGPLLDAVGVLHAEPVLVIMPDDSLLGEFRDAFAGVLGTLAEYPQPVGGGNPGFAGATEIIDGAGMWERLNAAPDTRIDARAFLTARLIDLLIGDWDRHRGQWRWAKIPGHARWQPIPEDRDQAFVRFQGLVLAIGRQRLPQFVSFGEDYPGIEGLTWNGRDVDRRILPALEKPAWDSTAATVRARITDAVIADAVSRLPAAYRALAGAELETALKSRRDRLIEITQRFYDFLARDVDVHGTDAAEDFTVTRADNGDVTIRVHALAGGEPYYQRTLHPDKTDEVRIYMQGGDDILTATGPVGDITVRVIGGDGDDRIIGEGLRVSDASGVNVVEGAVRLDVHPYTPPPRTTAEWIPPRDWGRRNFFYPWIGGNSDLGWLFLGTFESEGYGFRKDPFANRHTARLGYATRAGAFGGDYHGVFHHENSRRVTDVYVRLSGLDVLHFYGLGNESDASADEDFYKVEHTEYVFRPSMRFPAGGATAVFRLEAKYTKTNLDENRYIAAAPPYGSQEFFQTGAMAGIELDTRDVATNTTRGHHLLLEGAVFPPLGKVASTYGEIRGEASVYLTADIPLTPTLALRAGGQRVWGVYPWFEAAFIGGVANLRGFASQRFAGDASLYGNAELRVPLSRIYVLLPARVGAFVLGDLGRVYLDGESSNRWHANAGGGVWFSFIGPANVISIFAAAGDEDTRFYMRTSLGF